MSGERLDAVTPRPKNGGGTWWHRVGSAWKNEKGQITVYLDSVPVPDPERENKIVIMLFEPRDDDTSRKPRSTGGGGGGRRDIDDEVPF